MQQAPADQVGHQPSPGVEDQPKPGAKPIRTLLQEDIKRNNIAAWDINDKNAFLLAWKMKTRRILKDRNISQKCQISFIMGALQEESASAPLASWEPDGLPPNLSIAVLWATLFSPEASNFQINIRFKLFKLGNFSFYRTVFGTLSGRHGQVHGSTDRRV